MGKYYCTPFDITNYFSFNVGFRNIVVQSKGQPGVETQSTEFQLCEDNALAYIWWSCDRNNMSNNSSYIINELYLYASHVLMYVSLRSHNWKF